MTLAQSLARRFDGQARPELHLGGIPIRAIAARAGTPFYVYDREVLDRAWDRLRGALPDEVAISYSVKANPADAILRHFVGKGCGLEVASAGELERALAAGCPPASILFAGHGKTEPELELAVKAGIGEIHLESHLQAERVKRICERLGLRARVALRINPGGEAQGGAMQMGGRPAPFGVDEELLEEIVPRLCAETAFELTGIHVYAGTQVLEAATLERQHRRAFEIAIRLARFLGRPLKTVDLGGGFGIPYFAEERELDIERVGEGLAGLLREVEPSGLFEGTRVVVEPGRYLVGEAGVYVASVNDVKVSRGRTFVVLDGGMNHHLAASGNLGQVVKRNFPIAVLNKLDAPCSETVDLVGPLCTPLDTIGRAVRVPPLEVGDLVGIFQSGAYARSASPLGFLSRPAPAEVMVADGRLDALGA